MNTIMMPSIAIEDTLSFLAFPAKRAAAQVNGVANDLFENIATLLNQIISSALSARTAEQFNDRRAASVSNYMEVMLGLSRLINATVADQVIDRLTGESLSEMESDFRSDGVAAFGEYLTNQAMFTVFSLRKINDLANRIVVCDDLAHHLVPSDRDLNQKFLSNVLFGRYHLDCLTYSLRTSTPVFPEVIDCISDGLRPVVNAYSYIKQAADIRAGHDQEEMMIDIESDDEDHELLADSNHSLFQEA